MKTTQMMFTDLLTMSRDLAVLLDRLGAGYFDLAKVTTIEDLHIVDYVGPLEKELQVLVDFEGNVVGINRAIYDEDFSELLDYQPIP